MTERAKPLVLLLDDDEVWLRTLGRALELRGASVVAMTTPERLFTALEKGLAPDVMVIDYLLGADVSGGEVAAQVRGRMASHTPPLVLLSGTLERVPRDELDRFELALPKSHPLQELDAAILRLAKRGGQRGSHTRLTSAASEEAAERKARENTPV